MTDKLISQLRNLKNGRLNPDRVWLARNRERTMTIIARTLSPDTEHLAFWQKISETAARVSYIFVPRRLLAAARMTLTFILIGSLAVSGWIASVSASQNSLPGEALYGMKLAAEKTELIVATAISEERTAETNLKHAAIKVTEYQNAKSRNQASQSIQSLKQKIESTNKSLTKIETKSPAEAVAVAKVVEEKTEEILTALGEKTDLSAGPEVATTGKERETSVTQLTNEVAAVEKLIEATGVKAVGVLVEQQQDQTKEKIERKLDRLASDLVKLDSEIGVTSQLVAVSTTLASTVTTSASTASTSGHIDGIATMSAGSTTVSVVGSVQAIGTPTTSSVASVIEVKEAVQTAGQKVDEASKKGEETIVAAKTLIEQNDLKGALKKVQELGEFKQQAQAIVSEVKQVVSEAGK